MSTAAWHVKTTRAGLGYMVTILHHDFGPDGGFVWASHSRRWRGGNQFVSLDTIVRFTGLSVDFLSAYIECIADIVEADAVWEGERQEREVANAALLARVRAEAATGKPRSPYRATRGRGEAC